MSEIKASDDLEAAICRINSLDFKAGEELGGIIKKLSVDPADESFERLLRRRIETGRALILNGDYDAALELLDGLLKVLLEKNKSGENLLTSETLEWEMALIKSAAADAAYLKKRAVLYEKLRAGYEKVQARHEMIYKTGVGISFKKLKALIGYCVPALGYKRALSVYDSFISRKREIYFAGWVKFLKLLITGGLKFRRDDNEMRFAAMIQKSEWIKRQRPLVLLERPGAYKYKVCNLRWGFDASSSERDLAGPLWRCALIDASRVKDVYFVMKPFEPEWIAAHTLFVFEFDSPGAAVSMDGETTGALYFSIEPRLLCGQKYTVVNRYKGKFHNIYMLSTREDYMRSTAMEMKTLFPYKLKLDATQKRDLLKNCIESAFLFRAHEKYDPLDNNCTDNLFLLLNSVLSDEKKICARFLPPKLFNCMLSLPYIALKILERSGLIAGAMPPEIPYNQ